MTNTIKLSLTLALLLNSLLSIGQSKTQDLQIHKDLPTFSLQIAIGTAAVNDMDEFRIINKKTGKTQQVEGDFKVKSGSYKFEIQDLNFDGYADLRIDGNIVDLERRTALEEHKFSPVQQDRGGTQHCWLYNPKSQKYEYNKALSSIYQLQVLPDSKQLNSTEYTLYAHCQSSQITYIYTIEGAQVYLADKIRSSTNSNPNKRESIDIEEVSPIYPEDKN